VGTSLESLSSELVAVVESSAACVVHVEGRRHRPSSGVVWSADGVVVASHHALEADEDVPVGLADGCTLPARVVGRDPGSDLAVLRIEAQGLVPARWGQGGVKPGALVLGLSRPGRSLRARLGIVSVVSDDWRTPMGGRLEQYLESDIALHPGFSGGLLVGADGAALGVNTGGLMRGASLAVPAGSVRRAVEALLAYGRMKRGHLGIGTQAVALAPELRSRYGQASALIVLSVQPDSPASRAGILLGDVLLKAGDEPLTHPAALLPLLDEEGVGRELVLTLLRAGEVRTVTVAVGERDADQ
jgi:S1-C subfamily serine protease